MSTPSWVHRFNDADGSLKIEDLASTTSSYSKSSGSRPNLYQSRSRENLAPETRTYRHLASSTGNLSEGSGRVRTDYSNRQGNGYESPRHGTVNSGYVSDSGSSRYRSGLENGEELEMTPQFKTLQTHKKQQYSRNPNRTIDRVPRHKKDAISSKPKREESWSYVDSEGFSEASPSLHTSASCDDFEGTASSTSGSLFIPRLRNVASSSTLDQYEKRKRARRKDDSSNDTYTSGYSTNSVSEMSEYTNRYQSRHANKSRHPGDSRRPSADMDNGQMSPRSTGSRHSSEGKVSSLSHKRSESKLSINESDISVCSREKNKKHTEKDRRSSAPSIDTKVTTEHKSQLKAPTIGNVAVTVTNNIQYDPNDPFSFIQSMELPFHVKVRKCLGPVTAVMLLLILAGALGAAIYFASALKETQEKQIDMLKANLAVKIRNTGYMKNIEDLSSRDFKLLSATYCKQMDEFYSRSIFHSTYRGCEVLSFKDNHINFTLFFVEKEVTSNQIISVIESSAKRVENESHSLAIVDKFEIELDSAKVTMERKLEPESFNKKINAPQHHRVINVVCISVLMGIRDHQYGEDLNHLSASQNKRLSDMFCREMDKIFISSKLKSLYRGCETSSFRSNQVNFTLFFAEKEPTFKDIIYEIETSAKSVGPLTERVIQIDKFDLELEKVKFETTRKLEPENFNKILPPPAQSTAAPKKLIDILQADVKLNLRRYPTNLETLTAKGFEQASTAFCSQMDEYFHRSQYQQTYRGCSIKSLNNKMIDYCVYFVEKELKPGHITDVIRLYAKRLGTRRSSPVKIGKFEVELDTAKVDIVKRKKPDGFNRKLDKLTPTPTKGEDEKTVDKKEPPTDTPVFSWTPCAEYTGSYFPHPVRCNMFFQCTSTGESIEKKCAEGLLYHWKELTCVSRYMPNVPCPDPNKAPPRPTTTTTTEATSSQTISTIDPFLIDFNTGSTIPPTKAPTKVSRKIKLPKGMKPTEIAGRAKTRTAHPRDPCIDGVDGNLYPHPDDCGMFIQCVNGKVQNMNCAPKLVFDPRNKACVFAENAQLVCPDIRPCQNKTDGYFPHPVDCAKFIQCHFMKEKVMECTAGLVWNSKVNACVTRQTLSTVCPLDNLR